MGRQRLSSRQEKEAQVYGKKPKDLQEYLNGTSFHLSFVSVASHFRF
jgi:hypothetical protein